MKNTNILIVCGSFDLNGGKPSNYMRKIYDSFSEKISYNIKFINGGTLLDLDNAFEFAYTYNVVLWFPNIVDITNSTNMTKEKFKDIKKRNPSAILFISKNNLENKYTELQLISSALQSHAQRILEITKNEGLFYSRLLDPLGNSYGKLSDTNLIGEMLTNHVENLLNITRIRSVSIGESVKLDFSKDKEIEEFCELTRKLGDTLHAVMKTEMKTNRFFGNVSFRCESGFPAFKTNNYIYVSPRNVDKKNLISEQFVACENNDANIVKYYGTVKPSVDAPIQIALFNKYPSLNYMIHGHAYIKNINFTKHILPCGAFEEVLEISKQFEENKKTNALNLLGHGFIIMSNDFYSLKTFFESAIIYARPIPENHEQF